MDDYVSLPAKRLSHLVRKYVHHRQMKEIEGIKSLAPKILFLTLSVKPCKFTGHS